MIDWITFVNNNSVTLTLNHDTTTPYYPVTGFNSDIPKRFEKREKSATDGLWPTMPYDGEMDVTIEGAILGNDSTDYTTKRSTMMSCLRYKPTTRVAKDGRLSVKFTGVTNSVYADVVVETIDCPRQGLSPAYGLYRIVLVSFVPYYIDSVTSAKYYDE
jgi:hypothetical protein